MSLEMQRYTQLVVLYMQNISCDVSPLNNQFIGFQIASLRSAIITKNL